MFGRNDKHDEGDWMAPSGEPVSFLDPSAPDPMAPMVTELRERVTRLEQQVLAQYTATAAYATLAHQNVENARAESRADLDRAQSTVIGLLDRLRNELTARLDGVGAQQHGMPSTSLAIDAASRLAMLEDRLTAMTTAMEACVKENVLLRQQVDELLGAKMRQDGWLVASGGTSQLSLR